jgi:hypothetical protein
MDITLAYASEKFSIAVGFMASSTDSLHGRLAIAWKQELSMILGNDIAHLPPDIQARLSNLTKMLHAGDVGGAGPDIDSLVGAMDEGQVRDAIDEIVSLHYAIIRTDE